MDRPIASDAEQSDEKFLHVSYDERWEFLKSTIIRIYMEENSRMKQLVKRMKDEYSFDAQPRQYSYHFKKWEIKKRITTEEKTAVISALGKRRSREGVSTSDVTLDQGNFKKAVDKKQLKRHINDSIRRSASFTWRPGTFFQFDLPYTALVHGVYRLDHSSPSSVGPVTPQYLLVKSPPDTISSTMNNDMSPTMQMVQKKLLLDRATLFMEGRERDLLTQLNEEERVLALTWLHDFWMYSFMTAKYWNRGPRNWTTSMIRLKSLGKHTASSTRDEHEVQGIAFNSPSLSANISPSSIPSNLCRWSIHYEDAINYEPIPSPPPVVPEDTEQHFDIDDESTWTPWPEPHQNLAAIINQGFQRNSFSAIQSEQLPLGFKPISEAITKSPEEMQVEALGFAIMSHNIDAVKDNLGDISLRNRTGVISKIFPFHLAAKFLDGSKTCCLIMRILVDRLSNKNSVGLNYVNNSGHTVLDTLFVTILRSHSSLSSRIVNNTPIHSTGEDIDPCGRFDADSPGVRQWHALGKASIPQQWKHMFCHTSIQTVCHTISTIFGASKLPDINTPSGLFIQRCTHCGLELKLGPLHSLLLTAFYLANDGFPGETLFGMISCLVCLLTYRADPCATYEVSIPAILGWDLRDECQHSSMNAAELALRISLEGASWGPDIDLGWKVLFAILKRDIAERQSKPVSDNGIVFDHGMVPEDESISEDAMSSSCLHEIHGAEYDLGKLFVYCGNHQLGRLWAAVQAELLTYRRLKETDPWLSSRFNLEVLRQGLEDDNDECFDRLTGFTGNEETKRLLPYSRCGLFYKVDDWSCARREEVCVSHDANLDDWKRTTFIEALYSDGYLLNCLGIFLP
ncbi:hypothetical protein M426DRAFT_13590 [Hypoxylon sp. CI-4A]|nr:hypothetical protein M426DRAFT_13590 [Hypoxylon sp. CI-4A]